MSHRAPFGFNADRHERRHPWAALGLRVAICLAVTALMYFGLKLRGVSLVLVLTVWGYLLSSDLLAFISWVWQQMRAHVYEPEGGHHLAYKGVRIRHQRDELEPMEWLCIDDLSRALGEVIRPATVRQHHPDGVRCIEGLDYVSDDAAIHYLGSRQTFGAPGLRKWLAREVAYPVRHQRGR